MPFILIYLLKLSVSLAVVYLFYQLVLRKLTFHNWNRWYLLGYTLLSFIFPFINITPALERNQLTDNSVINWIPVFYQSSQTTEAIHSAGKTVITPLQVVIFLLLAGMLVMMLRLIVQFISFRNMRRRAVYLYGGKMKVYEINSNIIPFSFGKSVFINRQLHTEEELKEIIRHEFVHIRQRHSIDIIWSELLCLVNWFSPFAWLLKKAIRQNLEFIADNKVLDSGINKKEYQYLLLKVTGNNQYSIATPFNFSSLKKRIAMMNKLKSAKINSLRFLFILPVLAVIILSFRTELKNSFGKRQNHSGKIFGMVKDTVPDPPPPPPPPAPKKLPDNIKSVSVNNNIATIILKNGAKEIYNLDKPDDKKALGKKYGDIIPPPPPPPAPRVEGYSIVVPDIAEWEVSDKRAEIKFKNGKKETYDLTNEKDKKQFAEKYGKTLFVEGTPLTQVLAPLSAEMVEERPLSSTAVAPVVVAGYPIADVAAPLAISGVRTEAAIPAPVAITKEGMPVIAGSGTRVDVTSAGITGEEDILVTITKKTTRPQLDEFVKQMKEKGVELTYDEIEYDNTGNLVKISGKMKSKGSNNNFVASDFNKLYLAMVKKNGKTWFKVSTRDRKTVI